MPTTIQVSERLKRRLQKHKQHPRETYEDVIARALELEEEEDSLELSEETKAALEESYRDLKAGRVYPMEQVKKELGL